MSTKLQQEVWAVQRCSGCGTCVATCSKGVLHWNGSQHPMLEVREKTIGLSRLRLRTCEVCEKFCEISCPRLINWMPLDAKSMVAARSIGILQSGVPNDVAKALLVTARSADLIDGVVMLDMDPWNLTPTVRVAEAVEEIVGGMGMQYLWAPVLSSLNEAIFERGLSKLAIFGPPCVAQAAQGLKNTTHERLWPYQQSIRLILSSFCTGIYMPELIYDLLEKGNNIHRQQIRSIATSVDEGKMKVVLWNGTEHLIPLTEVEPFTRHGCSRCEDFLGDQADISLGTIGTKEGFSTLIVRTAVGEVFLNNALKFGLLEIFDDVDVKAVNAAKLEKDRRNAAKAYDEFQILILEALSDPKKRASVRNQFIKLYGTSPARDTIREKSNVTCSGC